jgi:hypothetical protein
MNNHLHLDVLFQLLEKQKETFCALRPSIQCPMRHSACSQGPRSEPGTRETEKRVSGRAQGDSTNRQQGREGRAGDSQVQLGGGFGLNNTNTCFSG